MLVRVRPEEANLQPAPRGDGKETVADLSGIEAERLRDSRFGRPQEMQPARWSVCRIGQCQWVSSSDSSVRRSSGLVTW